MTEILKGKTILVVEDEQDLREPLALEFESLGSRVLQAKNGVEALELVKTRKIDAVISDIRMPGGDGVELLKNIKALNRACPVVMLITGFSDLSREEAYHLGAEAILSKPFDLDELDACVARILTPREARWQSPALKGEEKARNRVARSFGTLAEAQAQGELAFGRGGIFLKTGERTLPVNAQVSLDIRFEKEAALWVEGAGVIRWSRAGSAATPSAGGCGIEFETLSEGSRSQVAALTEMATPFIPKEAPVAEPPTAKK